MRAACLAFLLIFCGLGVTAQAAPVADRLRGVDPDGTLHFTATGAAVLQGVLLQDGAEAWLLKRLDRPVWLRPGPQDRYGRRRVVVLENPKRNALSWQEQLLAAGFAVSYDRAAVPKKWLKAEHAPRPMPVTGLAGHVGAFVLMEGRVTRQFKSRTMWYVNFGEDWKTDVSLRIPRRAWRSMGENFRVQDGERVIARGALFLDNGPAMEITRPEQLAFPDRPEPAKAKKKSIKKKKPRKKSIPRVTRAKPKR